MKILAVDYGEKRTGLAISDAEEHLALALPMLRDADGEAVAAVARAQQAELVIVGLPLNMDGTSGPAAQRSRDFAEDVRAFGFVVELWDERLTTAEADARLRQAGLNRKDRAKRADTAAAIVILESFLEARRKKKGSKA